MDEGLVLPDGRLRSDDDALSRIVEALRTDDALKAVVDDLGSVPAARGTFGVLLPARAVDNGDEVLVKVNAAEHERRWVSAVHDVDPEVAPRMYGSGHSEALGVGWIAFERLPHQPPGFATDEWYESLITAAVRWQSAAANVGLEPLHAIDPPWLTFWIDAAVKADDSPSLRVLRERFDDDWAWVCSVCPVEPCHGDVHFFNAGLRMRDQRSIVLFDPIPRTAPWVFDAANCQTLTNYSGAEPLVLMAARLRRERGMPAADDDDLHRVSTLVCAWLSVMWRTWLGESQPDRRTSSARYVEVALGG